MPEPQWLRLLSDALATDKVTDATAAAGEALGYYMERPNAQEAFDQFKEALEGRQKVREDDYAPAAIGVSAAANLLPQTRVIKGIQAAKQLVEGGGFLGDMTKKNVRIGNKKFPSKRPKALDDAEGQRIEMEGGHYGIPSKVEDGSGAIRLYTPEGDHYQTIRFAPDRDGTISIHHDFPTKFGESNPDIRRGRSREMRHILADTFGGIGSDPSGNNTDVGINAYYKDPRAMRVYPEELEGSKKAVTNYNRFFTPGTDKQKERFEDAFREKYDDASPMAHKESFDPFGSKKLREELQRRYEQTAQQRAEAQQRRANESASATREILEAAPDIYSRKQAALNELPEGSDDRRYIVSDRRRELLDYLPGRDRDELVSQHSGDLLDEKAMSWADLLKAIKNR